MQSRKKKTMKTNTQNPESGAREQIRNTEQNNTNTDTSRRLVSPKSVEGGSEAKAEAQTPPQADTSHPSYPSQRQDTRLPIDTAARKQNRTLPTPKVLNLLHTQLPAAYRLAEVVGKWVWVTFKEQPAAEIRQQLAQLGFHWNRERQAWQHPCGKFSLGSQADPHEKYSAYFPAHVAPKRSEGGRIKTPRRAEASAKAGAQPIAAAA